jgi:hypothetical protein
VKYGAGICQLIGPIRKPKGGNTSGSFPDLKDIQNEKVISDRRLTEIPFWR